jgi:hypothetical protein
MNDIYRVEQSLLQNFFIPQIKLKTKCRVGSKYKRTYTKPKTPYQILQESDKISPQTKTNLHKLYESLNPFSLKASLDQKLQRFFKSFTQVSERKAA